MLHRGYGGSTIIKERESLNRRSLISICCRCEGTDVLATLDWNYMHEIIFLSVEAKMTQIKRKHHKKCDKQNELKNSQGDFQLR